MSTFSTYTESTRKCLLQMNLRQPQIADGVCNIYYRQAHGALPVQSVNRLVDA